MKHLIAIAALSCAILVGCSSDAGTATEEDKANIERMSKEGITPQPPPGGQEQAQPGGGVQPP